MYCEQQHVHKALAYIVSFHPICGTQYLTEFPLQVSCLDFLVFESDVAHTVTLCVEETEELSGKTTGDRAPQSSLSAVDMKHM